MKKLRTILALVLLGAMLLPTTAFAQETIDSVYLLPKDNVAAVANPQRNYLQVVNPQHPMSDAEIAAVQEDLVYFPNAVDGDTMAVEKAAYLAFTRLQQAMEEEGVKIALYDGYRTKRDQLYLIENGLVTTVAAVPGQSEHHTGLLLDVVVWYDGQWCSENEARRQLAPWKKLHERMADYGFIERYPAGKECVTGLPAIPYEMRFVGTSVAAHVIADNGLCLEEFVGIQ